MLTLYAVIYTMSKLLYVQILKQYFDLSIPTHATLKSLDMYPY